MTKREQILECYREYTELQLQSVEAHIPALVESIPQRDDFTNYLLTLNFVPDLDVSNKANKWTM